MSLERLWAGWRSTYVTSVSSEPETALEGEGSCVFCKLLDGVEGNGFVVYKDALAAAILNAYPYASGHLLVMPVRHLRELDELTDEESAAVWATMRNAVTAIRRAYSPDGLNLGANLGRAAGAGLPDHLHLHVLPRWVGDTSFMTSVAEVRVLPEPLPQSGDRLRAAWPD